VRTPELPPRIRRPLRRLRRSPVAHWLAAGVLGLATYGTIEARSAELDRRERALGDLRPVLVLRAGHRAGALLDADDVVVRRVPSSLIPAHTVRTLDRPVRLRVPVAAGEVLVRERVVASATSSAAAAIPDAWRAVAVPLPDGALRLRRGDRVDVLALGAEGVSEVVVPGALVVDAADRSVGIAVPRERVATVADAVLAATVTLSLVGAN
jgi:Flp pilus assembly protein CpaB